MTENGGPEEGGTTKNNRCEANGEREQNLRWKEHFEEVLNQPEPLFTADFGDTVMADYLRSTRDTSTLKKFNVQSIGQRTTRHQAWMRYLLRCSNTARRQ